MNASQAEDATGGGVTQEDNSIIGPGSKKKKVVRKIVHRRSTVANNIVQGKTLSETNTSIP